MNEKFSVRLSRRSLLGLGLGAAGATVLPACSRGLGGSSSSSKSVEFMFWGEGDQNKKLVDALDLFQKTKGAPKIKSQFQGFDGYYDKLATRVAGGNPPDVFQIHLPFLNEYIERDAVLDLSKYADDLGLAELPDYVATTTKAKGKYWFALHGAATQPAVVVNRTRLDKLGLKPPPEKWTFDDFVDTMEEVWRKSGKSLHGTSDLGGNPITLEAFMRSRGKKLFAGDGSFALSAADLTTWLELWEDLRKSGAAVPMKVTAAGTGFQNDPLTLGKTAYTVTPTSRGLPAIQSLNKDELALATFPSGGSGEIAGTNIIPAGWFAISPKAGDVEGAVKMLKYLTSEPKAAAAMGMARGVPIPSDIRAGIAKSSKGLDSVVLDNYKLVESQNPEPLQMYPKGAGKLLQEDLHKVNENIGFGKLTPAKGAAEFLATAEEALA